MYSQKLRQAKQKEEDAQVVWFDKGWFVLQYSGYENKLKRIFLQRAQTPIMLENILRKFQLKPYQVEKNSKTKRNRKKPLPRLCLGRNGRDR